MKDNRDAEAVDIEPDEVEGGFKSEDRYRAMKRALREARQELGQWPGANEWDRSGRRPAGERTCVGSAAGAMPSGQPVGLATESRHLRERRPQ
jgi:hypothetical protein